jgi:hypothetical protein
MACFLVPAAEAVAATAIKKVEEKKEPGMTENITEISEEVTIPGAESCNGLHICIGEGPFFLHLNISGMEKWFRGSHS